ncbi:MAG: hypothetical protein ACFFCW_01375 [Candidatus Hodarchaeota archaeon]
MGDYSRNPKDRLTDSIAKHYVGVRMQQGVPILDADWNLLEDIRRYEFEQSTAFAIGDGVPTGNDGFRIYAGNDDNDFRIHTGLIILNGKLIENHPDTSFLSQPNKDLLGSPSPLDPPADKLYTVFLDFWEQEVDSTEDDKLVDDRIGVPTTVRVKRDWVVRVVEGESLPPVPAGHFFRKLAEISRQGSNAKITQEMIKDLRITQNSIRREIEFKKQGDAILVDNAKFRNMLEGTRDNFRDFAKHLATKFVDVNTSLFSGEIIAIEALTLVSKAAEAGLTALNNKTTGNREALDFFTQLLAVQQYFVSVWKEHLFSVERDGETRYRNSFQTSLNRIESYLRGASPPGGHKSIQDSLSESDLHEAYRSQLEINNEIGQEVGKTRGIIDVYYVRPDFAGDIDPDTTYDFIYEAASLTTTQPDDYLVTTTIDAGWQASVHEFNAGRPGLDKLRLGAAGSTEQFVIRVTTPAAAVGTQATLTIKVELEDNPEAIYKQSAPKLLEIGKQPPGDETNLRIDPTAIFNATLISGFYEIKQNVRGRFELTVLNLSGEDADFNLTHETKVLGSGTLDDWEISPSASGSETVHLSGDQTGSTYYTSRTFRFKPTVINRTIQFVLTAESAAPIGGQTLSSSITLNLKSVS